MGERCGLSFASQTMRVWPYFRQPKRHSSVTTKLADKEANRTGNCRLCGKSAILRRSHIYPRFIFKWMAGTAAGTFRHAAKPNRPVQDGFKLPLLCHDCEQRFSAREAWFARTLFFPFVNDGILPQEYDHNLFYFIISLAWRLTCLPRQAGPPEDLMENVDREWRQFLLNGQEFPKTYDVAHLILCNPDEKAKFAVKQLLSTDNFARYFGRNTDGALVGWEDNFLVYIKLPCFLFFVPMTPLDERKFVNTRISYGEGNLLNRQEVTDPWIISILQQRASIVDDHWQDLNDRQTEKVRNELLRNPNSHWAKMFWSDVNAATVRQRPTRQNIQGRKIGRNELCLCNSGKKFKYCCGATR